MPTLDILALEVNNGGIKYSLDRNNRTAAVAGSTLSTVVIPETFIYDDITYTVTSIAEFAFQYNTTVTSVKCSNSIKTIGKYAFYGAKSLQRIDIGNAVTIIEGSAFYNCEALKYIVIPQSVTKFANDVFYNCSSLTIICLKEGSYTAYPSQTVYPSSFMTFISSADVYNGQAPDVTYTFNGIGNGFTPKSVEIQSLPFTAGYHTEKAKCTFANGFMSFDVDIPFAYYIKPVTLTAKVKDASRLYGDANPEFSSTYTGFVNNEDESVIISHGSFSTATENSDVGTYAITQSGASAQNYVFEYESGTLTVNKAPLTMTANNKSMTYGSQLPTLDAKYKGLKNNESKPAWVSEPVFTTTANANSTVGNYPITISNAEAKNYQLTVNNGTLSVEKAPLTVKAENKSRDYGDANPEFTLKYTGLQNDETQPEWDKAPVMETTATVQSAVGSYPISVKDAVAVNYEITSVDGTLTVNKATLRITPKDATRKYGEDNPKFELLYAGLKNNENVPEWNTEPVITTQATKGSSVGEYAIQISTAEAKNYTLEKKVGTLTITKAPVTVALNNYSRKYGMQNPNFEMQYTGLVNGETAPTWTELPAIATEATVKSDVGEYAITATGGIMKNYSYGEITPGVLTVTTAPLTITANDAVRAYYVENPLFNCSYNGFVNGDDENVLIDKPVLSTPALKTSNVGTYKIEVSGTSSKNYSVSHVNGTLSITPRTLQASVGNYERIYNEDNPVFEVKYNGFVGNEDESVLIEKAVATTTADKTTDVGTYPINVSGGIADNYTFSYTSGFLTINKAEQSISWEQDLSDLKIGDQVELKASATSGLPITYTLDNEDLAEIYSAGNKTYLDCKGGGQFIIRAIQEGNNNYYSSPRLSNRVSIASNSTEADPVLTIMQADNGSVSMHVAKGSIFTFKIEANSGWKIHTVTFNDEDVTSQMNENNQFTTPAITDNSTLIVVYEQVNENGVRSAELSPVIVQGKSFGVRVIGAVAGEMIQVYTADGVLLKSVTAEGQQTDFQLSKGSVYIVKVGTKNVKLSL